MNAQQRLEKYRKRASGYGGDWRSYRFEKYHIPDRPVWSDDRSKMFLDQISIGEELGISSVFTRSNYEGWYVDYDNVSTMVGCVVQLRTSKGRLLVPVTRCSGWEGVTYYMEDAQFVDSESDFDDIVYSVALAADRHASHEAARCREDWLEDKALELEQAFRDKLKKDVMTKAKIKRQIKRNIDLPYVLSLAIRDYIAVLDTRIKNSVLAIRSLHEDPYKCIVEDYDKLMRDVA